MHKVDMCKIVSYIRMHLLLASPTRDKRTDTIQACFTIHHLHQVLPWELQNWHSSNPSQFHMVH